MVRGVERMAEEKGIRKYRERVRYTKAEIEKFYEVDPRVRQVKQPSRAASRYSIQAEVIQSKHCNSDHAVGERIILDVDGNFIPKLCPEKMCADLISQLIIPAALINERLSEEPEPNDFHFIRLVRCLDTGVECCGDGEVLLRVQVVPRVKGEPVSTRS
jgi:hypothetical protein